MGIQQASTPCPPCMATSKWEMVPTWHRHVRTGHMWGHTTRFFQSKSQFILNKTVNVIQWTEVFSRLLSLGKYMLCLLLALWDVCYRVMPATQSWWVVAAHDQDQSLSPERETVINAESLAVGTGRQSCFHRQNLRVLRDFSPPWGFTGKSHLVYSIPQVSLPCPPRKGESSQLARWQMVAAGNPVWTLEVSLAGLAVSRRSTTKTSPPKMSTRTRPLSKLSCGNRNHSRETNHFLKAVNQENVTILNSKELTSPVGRTRFP